MTELAVASATRVLAEFWERSAVELGLEDEYVPEPITESAVGPPLEYVPSPIIRISTRPHIVRAAP